MKILISIFGLFLCISCTYYQIFERLSFQEKSFISLDAFIETQKVQGTIQPPLFPGNVIYQPVYFDSLSNFRIVDTLIEDICKKDNPFGFCCIPIIYKYKNDTILLPLFPFTCRCCVDIKVNHILVNINNNQTTFLFSKDQKIDFNNNCIEDSLYNIFTNSLTPFIQKLYLIKSEIKDSIRANSHLKLLRNYDRILFKFELQNDDQLQEMKKPLDLIIEIYLKALRNNIKLNYKKDISELELSEIKILTENFFLIFETLR